MPKARSMAQPQVPRGAHERLRLEARRWGQPLPQMYAKAIEVALPRLEAARLKLAEGFAQISTNG